MEDDNYDLTIYDANQIVDMKGEQAKVAIMQGSEAFMLVFDMSQRKTFEQLEQFFKHLHKVKDKEIVSITNFNIHK